MKRLFRLLIALALLLAVYLFGAMVFAVILLAVGIELPVLVSNLIVLAVAGTFSFLGWRLTASAREGAFMSAAVGALLLGGIAFIAGFVGPIEVSPDSPQGPLLGIFITGPLGFLLGGLGGLLHWRLTGKRQYREVIE